MGKMVIRDIVRKSIDTLPAGVVVTASDFDVPREYRATLIKALNQFESSGVLKRVSKGRYYKPRQSRFGELKPSETEIVKDFLEKNGKTIGYMTGTRAFAALALTTQISNSIMIGTNVSRRPITRGQYKITFLLQANPITEEDIPLFLILDSLRLIKEIPATTPDEIIAQVAALVRSLSQKDRERLAALALNYQPFVRAQTGAILELLGEDFNKLQESLNPISRYNLGIKESTLSTVKNWNIV